MAQAGRSATFEMLAASILLLGVCDWVAGGDAAVQSPKQEKGAIARSLDRAEKTRPACPSRNLSMFSRRSPA